MFVSCAHTCRAGLLNGQEARPVWVCLPFCHTQEGKKYSILTKLSKIYLSYPRFKCPAKLERWEMDLDPHPCLCSASMIYTTMGQNYFGIFLNNFGF